MPVAFDSTFGVSSPVATARAEFLIKTVRQLGIPAVASDGLFTRSERYEVTSWHLRETVDNVVNVVGACIDAANCAFVLGHGNMKWLRSVAPTWKSLERGMKCWISDPGQPQRQKKRRKKATGTSPWGEPPYFCSTTPPTNHASLSRNCGGMTSG